ncbi:MAG: YacL family protein [Chloroflexota bacterium]
MESNFYINDAGYAKAEFSSPYELIGWFLSSEIGGSIEELNFYLSRIEDVKSGKLTKFEADGNAHIIRIDKEHVQIIDFFLLDADDHPDHPENNITFALKMFEEIIAQWLKLISQNVKDYQYQYVNEVI